MKKIRNIKSTNGRRLKKGMCAVYGKKTGKPRKARRNDPRIGIYIGGGKIIFSDPARSRWAKQIYITHP